MRILSFNANGLRSAASKGFFDWFARATWTCCACRRPRRRNTRLGDAAGLRKEFSPTATARSSRTRAPGRATAASRSTPGASRTRCARSWAGRRSTTRAATSRRASASSAWCRLHPVRDLGRGTPGVQVRGDGPAGRCSTSGWRAAATTSCAATGTSCAASATSGTGSRTRRTPVACPRERAWLNNLIADDHGRRQPAPTEARLEGRVPRGQTDAVEYSWWSARRRARQQRRLAHRLPDRDAGHRRTRARRGDLPEPRFRSRAGAGGYAK